MVATVGVRLIVTIVKSVLFIAPVDSLVIELSDACQVGVESWYVGCSCELYLFLASWRINRDRSCAKANDLFCMRAHIDAV